MSGASAIPSSINISMFPLSSSGRDTSKAQAGAKGILSGNSNGSGINGACGDCKVSASQSLQRSKSFARSAHISEKKAEFMWTRGSAES
jgi:hypothetical protein